MMRWIPQAAILAWLLVGLPRPAAAMCTGAEPFFYDVEVTACEPSREIAERLLDEGCRAAIAAGSTATAEALETERKGPRSGPDTLHRSIADIVLSKADMRAEKLRRQSADFVLVMARILRVRRGGEKPGEEGAWQAMETPASHELMIHHSSDPDACAQLLGQRVELEVKVPCCDFNPDEVLVCSLGYEIGHVATASTDSAGSTKDQ